MSAKLNTYNAIKAQILGQVPKIKTVQLFNNQFDKEAAEDAFSYPAVMIQFLSLPWVTEPQGLQKADALIRLHVGFHSYKSEDVEILTLLDEVHAALSGFTVANLLGAMTRTNEEQDINHDSVSVWLVDYSTQIVDVAGHRNRHLVNASIESVTITTDPSAPYLKHK